MRKSIEKTKMHPVIEETYQWQNPIERTEVAWCVSLSLSTDERRCTGGQVFMSAIQSTSSGQTTRREGDLFL